MSTLTNLGNNFTLSLKDVEMALVILHAVPSLEGDFDGDNDVDGADFLLWQRGGSPNPFSPTDLANWQMNYSGVASNSAASSIPEPASAWLLAVAGMPMVESRRRSLGL